VHQATNFMVTFSWWHDMTPFVCFPGGMLLSHGTGFFINKSSV